MKIRFNQLDVFKTSVSLLKKNEKIKLIIYCLICFISFSFDILTVFSIFPFVSIILNPDLIYEDKSYNYIWNLLGSPTINIFIIYLSLSITLIIISSSLISLYSQYRLNIFAARCQSRLGNDIVRNFAIMNYEWHLQKNSIKLMNLFSNHLAYWSRGVIKQIPLLIGYISCLIIPLVSVVILSPRYGLFLLFLISFLIFYFLKYIRIKTNRITNLQRIKIDEINIFLTELLQGIKDIKLSNNTNNFLKKFNYLWKDFAYGQAQIENYNLLPANTVLMLSQLSVVILGTALFVSDISQSRLVGIMTVITLLAFKIVPLLNKLGNSLNAISNAHVFSRKLKEIFLEVDPGNNKDKSLNNSFPSFSWNKLSLIDVNYKYPSSKNVSLNNINLEIEKGSHYGFVGFSGAGKSTTVDICNGLLNPTKGNVLVDGVNLEKFGVDRWQSKIGYVPQQPKINDLTIKENIAFGIELADIDEDKVLKCLEIVGLKTFVYNLPQGLLTNLKERGKLFSGGQQQLIAIARALYKDPEIIILDEATNSLDSISQDLIRSAFNKLHRKVTLISISHQFSTLKFVDHIFLFKNGQLVDQGDLKYLYENSILFKKFADSQLNN